MPEAPPTELGSCIKWAVGLALGVGTAIVVIAIAMRAGQAILNLP